MNHPQNPTLETFITWFVAQTDIPLQIRRDFVAHLQKNQRFDDTSLQFVSQWLQRWLQRSDKNLAVLDHKLALIDKLQANEAHPETALKKRISDEAVNTIEFLSQDFKHKFKQQQFQARKKAETLQQNNDAAEVAELKAAI